jgi:hypothetical protein
MSLRLFPRASGPHHEAHLPLRSLSVFLPPQPRVGSAAAAGSAQRHGGGAKAAAEREPAGSNAKANTSTRGGMRAELAPALAFSPLGPWFLLSAENH